MPTLTRHPDWPQRLTQYVLQAMPTPFAWGRHDCVTFAADGVRVMTGVDLLAALRDEAGALPWTTPMEAYRVLQPLGGLEAAVRSAGLEEVAPRLARRGDVVLVRGPARKGSMRGALGLCLGERIAAPAHNSLAMSTLSEGLKAWRV